MIISHRNFNPSPSVVKITCTSVTASDKPLASMPISECEAIWTKLVCQIRAALVEHQKHQVDGTLCEEKSEQEVDVDDASFPLVDGDGSYIDTQSCEHISVSTDNENFYEQSMEFDLAPDLEQYDLVEAAAALELRRNRRFTNHMLPSDDAMSMFTHGLLEAPDLVQNYWVYPYEHIDILDFMPRAKDVPGGCGNYNALILELSRLFMDHGREGDGEIRLLWFAPFLGIGGEDTWGTLAWFVKQENNGTAFIASPVMIPYLSLPSRLQADNDGYYTTTIVKGRHISGNSHLCYQINGLLPTNCLPLKGETHWLLYFSNRFEKLHNGDRIRFKPKGMPQPLRDFSYLKYTRNIYVEDLQKLS